MKEKLQEKLELLSAADSPYFCGSSCLLSLYDVLCEIELNTVDFEKAFPHLKENVLKLFDEDPRLFELSKKKEAFFEEEWKEVINILYDYASWLEDMNQLIALVRDAGLKQHVEKLRMDVDFLVAILKETLVIFENREDLPPEFARAENEVLTNIRKGA